MAALISIGRNKAGPGSTQINNVNVNNTLTNDEIDRACLRALRCPDSAAVKIGLKEKDKLLYKAIDWIYRDSKYAAWYDGNNVHLLLIKGGAGKGKTMMSISLIEHLQDAQEQSTVVTYFFCRNDDNELNTIGAIIKGLLLQLVNQKAYLKESLRRRWDSANKRFEDDMTSWRTLWEVFLEMLDHCKSRRTYIVVDALDECRGEGMADFLKLIVRTGLGHRSKVKWLLTSRPLDSAEQELLGGSDQELVSLELNSSHVAQAVSTYAASRATELDRRHRYGPVLRDAVEAALIKKFEYTFLWVSLVCRRLESVGRNKALSTIEELPPGLQPYYNRILHQLNEGESGTVEGCMRLLKVMLLVYRPLRLEEINSVTGLSNDNVAVEALVDRCASFVRKRGADIEFVHKSAPDYLHEKDGHLILNAHTIYRHDNIALSCLSYLTKALKVNLANLPQHSSPRDHTRKENAKLASLDYAATFWMQHLTDSRGTQIIQQGLTAQKQVQVFFQTKVLEWLECLSLLDELPRTVEGLKILRDMFVVGTPVLLLIDDTTRFLLRHYHTIANWPLQIYSSAIIFSPRQSIIRKNNQDKVPSWLRRLPEIEEAWSSLIATLTGHDHWVCAVAFSPDGRRIASASHDATVKLWDAASGDLRASLVHRFSVTAVAFSPNGQRIASASNDMTVRLWGAATGNVQARLMHGSGVNAVTFSPNGQRIASASNDKTVKLWDAATGTCRRR